MREFATPLATEVAATGNLTDDVVLNGTRHPDDAVLSRRGGSPGAGWEDVTAAQFLAEVRAVARGLVAAGLQPGDRVALVSSTRYEWTLLDYAIWFAGCVTVPAYETSSAEELAWVIGDSGARGAVVETTAHVERVEEVRPGLSDLEQMWCLDQGAVAGLVEAGRGVSEEVLERRRTAATAADLATIVYTSGTTGPPKGCMLTHGNLMFELDVATGELSELFADDDASTLLFLPLAHVFARVIQVGCVRTRTRLGHHARVADLPERLDEFRPSFVLAVPRVFEQVFNTASQRATADGRGARFDRAARTAIEWSRALDRGRPGPRLRAQHALYARTVYPRLLEALGGRCRYAIAGGAPLGERLGHFYRGIGLTILEGYGMTETTAAVSVNLPGLQKVGTVGRPLPGTSVRIADDGELLFAGGQVFAGYWGDDEATATVLDEDGWIRTGDVGEVDDEGFVRITGRKKEILVTAGGKNVSPAVLEDGVRAHPLVSHCLVVGDGRPFVAALVTLDAEAFTRWASARGKRGPVAEHITDPDLRAEIAAAVEEANTAVSRAESIRRFAVLPHDWTEEDGQLTPSLKLRRSVVLRECRADIDDLYRG